MSAPASTTVAPKGGRLLVAGRGGLLSGVRRVLAPGQILTAGRSRSCDISLRRTKGFVTSEDPLALLRSKPFRRVSRVHCEVRLCPDGRIEVLDRSRNGTLVDGARVMGKCVLQPAENRVAVQLGDDTVGTLILAREPGAASPSP